MSELDYVSRIPRRIEYDDGVRRAFTPALIQGCVGWWSASLGVTKDGSNNISAVADQVGGHNAAEGTGANQQLWVASASNGMPAARGNADGARALLMTGAALSGSGTIVFAFTKSTRASTYMLRGASDQSSSIIENFSGNALEWFNNNGVDRATFSSNPAAGAHVVSVVQTDGSSCVGRYDGTQVFSITPTAAITSPTIIGNLSTLTNGSNGDWMQLAVFNRALQLPELNRYQKYLGFLYGIAVAG